MDRRLIEIETRRARLLERAARERAGVAQTLQLWEQPLGFVDRCLEAVRFVVSRPPLVAGATFALVLLRPRSALKWARRAFGLWQGYRWLRNKTTV
jgi:hypothetical protein